MYWALFYESQILHFIYVYFLFYSPIEIGQLSY